MYPCLIPATRHYMYSSVSGGSKLWSGPLSGIQLQFSVMLTICSPLCVNVIVITHALLHRDQGPGSYLSVQDMKSNSKATANWSWKTL